MKKEIIIEGMMCDNCAHHVEEALKNLGIKKVKVNLKKGNAIIKNDIDINNNEIINSIKEVGYKVIEIK